MLLIVMLALYASAAAADISFSQIYTLADPDSAQTRIDACTMDGELTVVLPAGTALDAVPLYYSCSDSGAAVAAIGANGAVAASNGCTLNLTELCGDTERFEITLRARSATGTVDQKLVFRRVASVDAVFLVSDDPVNQGREWVEASPDKTNKATGSMVMLGSDGTTVYSGGLTQIKGRGNSTWNGAKKPYQIKLSSKTDLLQTGDKDNRAKTWVLLANFFDSTMLRNSIAFDLAAAMGMDPALQYTPISLYYDGEYRGAYVLSEKVEINSGRVDITDLEEANEAANPTVEDLTELPTATGKTDNGATYIYCTGMQSPEDITGGYLLEIDMASRAQEEICYFVTSRGEYVVVKSPECCSKEEMAYIASLYQEYEDAVYSGGTNAATGKSYAEYVNLESIVQCYLINEISKNPDGFHTSAYLYKDAGSDMMRMGPIWDYDLAFGIGVGANSPVCAQPEGLFTAYTDIGTVLYQNSAFRMEVQRQYTQIVAPLMETLCGDENAVNADGALHSIAYYAQRIEASAACNQVLWPQQAHYTSSQPGGAGWQPNVDFLKYYIQARGAWLLEEFSSWRADGYDELEHYMDVQPDDWFYENVLQATQYGLMQGTGSGIFSPLNNTTRAQTAQVLYNLEKPGSVPFARVFSDVNQGDWFASPVMWAYDEGVVQGYPDGTFRPNAGVTRQDMLVLLYRHAGEPAVENSTLSAYSDASAVSEYARAAVEWALDQKIIEGYTDSTLRPKKTTTRAEFATIILRYYEKYEK